MWNAEWGIRNWEWGMGNVECGMGNTELGMGNGETMIYICPNAFAFLNALSTY